MTFVDLFDRWDLMVPDLLSEYRVDVHDRGMLGRRPWVWLRALIMGLLSADTRLGRWVADEQKDGSAD